MDQPGELEGYVLAWAEARGVTRRRGLCVHDPRVHTSPRPERLVRVSSGAWAEARGVTRRRGLCVHDPRVLHSPRLRSN